MENVINIILRSNQEKQEMSERAIELLEKIIQQEEDVELYN